LIDQGGGSAAATVGNTGFDEKMPRRLRAGRGIPAVRHL